jgi:FkbM family methyltransferase
MKKIIKKILPRPVIDYLIYIFYYKIYRRGYFAQNEIDKKLKRYLNFQNGFFVELGANDGFTASNTLYFEQKMNWRGVLVEPSPNLFLSCIFYRNKLGNSIYCNACVPFGYEDKYVDIEYAYLMSTSKNLDSDIPDKESFMEKARENTDKYQRNLRFGSSACTLTSILDQSNAPTTIDFLSLDVEGAELDVLKGVNFKKYIFNYILVECRDIKRLSEYLAIHGYVVVDKLSFHDYLFMHSKKELAR